MKVLILSINYWPEVTGIGAFTTYRAEYLAAAGHDVEVCTTFPYYPDWKVPPAYSGKLFASETRNGVRIRRSFAYIPSQASSVKRILHEASFITLTMARAAFCYRPDVLLVVSPPLGLAAPAILLSRLWRIPYVFDVEDLQPDSAADLGMLPASAVKLLYGLESMAYRHAKLVTTLTATMGERIAAKGVPKDKIALIEPRVDESLFDVSPEEGHAFRARYGIDGKFLITYSGNIGVKQKLDVVIEAAALHRSDDSVLFLIVGNGVDCARIQHRASELGLSNVRFLPLLDELNFRGLLSASDVCLVTQQRTASEIAFPSKVVTYLAAGCPIIASVSSESEVARIALESGAGAVAEAENGAALINAIMEIRKTNLVKMGIYARAYAIQRWSAEPVLGHLERSLADAASPVRLLANKEKS
jgi:colanic acid biosynthesis glycosyl transferase WcaI